MVILIVIVSGLGVLLVLAVLALVLSQNTTRLNRTPQAWDDTPPPELSASETAHLLRLIEQGKKIEAIQHYKFMTGCSLKVAKAEINRLSLKS